MKVIHYTVHYTVEPTLESLRNTDISIQLNTQHMIISIAEGRSRVNAEMDGVM